MSGRELHREQIELGIGPEAVCSEAGISMSSLYKVYNDVPVRDSTRAKVKNALARIRARTTGAAPPTEPGGQAAVG